MEVNRSHRGALRRSIVAHFPERVLGGHNDPGTAPVIEAQSDSLNIGTAAPNDFKGKRISAAKGSTSELSITLNGSEPVTFQDTGSAYMALQQNKSVGMVANTMTITDLVAQSKASDSPQKMIAQPMLLEPVAIGMKQGEPVLLDKVNEALLAMDKAGEIDAIWARWLGPDTRYKLTRDEHVQPMSSIKFTPIP